MVERIEIAHRSEAPIDPKKGYGGQRIFESPLAHVGLTTLNPGAVTAWHHHAARTFYGYVVAGRLRLEYGRGGQDAATAVAGEFLRIPPGLIHRDVNATQEPVVVATIAVGEGELAILTDGPEG